MSKTIAPLNPEFWCPGWLLGTWSVIRNNRVFVTITAAGRRVSRCVKVADDSSFLRWGWRVRPAAGVPWVGRRWGQVDIVPEQHARCRVGRSRNGSRRSGLGCNQVGSLMTDELFSVYSFKKACNLWLVIFRKTHVNLCWFFFRKISKKKRLN